MLINRLCPPAFIYVVILMVHLIMELYDAHYIQAFLKVIVSVVIIALLQILCLADLSVIAWILVFLPLIIYTYMTVIVFFVFGLNPKEKVKKFEVKS
jgi:hypothetical protein